MPENLKWLLPDGVVGSILLSIHEMNVGLHQLTGTLASIVSLAYFTLRFYRYARRPNRAREGDDSQ